jgi:AAA+ superfamily predicted ATPase
MINFTVSPNSLLDSFEKIYKTCEDSELKQEQLIECQKDIENICQFFNCSEQEALVMSILLRMHYHSDEPSVEELLKHTSLKISSAIYINQLLKPFTERGWIKPVKNVLLFPLTNYKLSARFIRCVTNADWSLMELKTATNSFDLIETYGKLLAERKVGDMSYSKFQESTQDLINKNKILPIVSFMNNLKMSLFDSMVFLNMCSRSYKGNSTFEFEYLFDDFRPPNEEQYAFRKLIKSKKGVFFENQIVTQASDSFSLCGDEYQLSDIAISCFDPEPVKENKNIKSKFLEKIDHSKIREKSLFYSGKDKTQIDRLRELLLPENFSNFQKRMNENQKNAGLTVLFFGSPGVGKTESVYQLAHQSKRHILSADASTIRSKWIGETEQHIKQLFDDYKKAKKHYEQTPILLFNEADSILSKRRRVTEKVDQMENTMQNILLQELENFEGIFIATTNLEENLDNAFDRRILYKIRFNPPTDELRMSIWKDKMKEIDEDLLHIVNNRYKLTGGQIDNISKKVEVEKLLSQDKIIDIEYLSTLAEEEVSLRSETQKRQIGFNLNN